MDETLYVVIGLDYNEYDEEFERYYGVFSTQEKAEKIRKNLENNASEWGLTEKFSIQKAVLDEPNEVYDFVMNN